jgi:TPR repeat protein|tara:strand:+ start:1836 stop:2423 length:588 start_codon:yes stop_codon:yes gene_type:complete
LKGSLRLLILLVIFLSQYICAEDYLKDAQDGQPRAQYLYAMNLLKKGNKNEALDWLIIAAAQGHLRSSLWIEQNTDYQEDIFMSALVLTNNELKNKVKPYTSNELEQMKKIGKEGNSDTQFLIWLLYVNNLYISKPKAYVWIKKAAFNKHPRATFAMGLLYYYGYIVPEQKSKAIKLFNESSALGYSFAESFLNK